MVCEAYLVCQLRGQPGGGGGGTGEECYVQIGDDERHSRAQVTTK